MKPSSFLVLRSMRVDQPKINDWHDTLTLSNATRLSRRTVCSALRELHAASLVEPGRRSMWRLSALGRSPAGTTFTSPQ